jgi:hypothetical protein
MFVSAMFSSRRRCQCRIFLPVALPSFLLLTSSRIFRRGRRGVIAGISFGEINLASRRSAAGDTGRFQIDRPLQGAPGHVTPSMRCTGRNAANTTTYPNTRRQSRAVGRIRLRREASERDETGIFFLGYRCPGHRLRPGVYTNRCPRLPSPDMSSATLATCARRPILLPCRGGSRQIHQPIEGTCCCLNRLYVRP